MVSLTQQMVERFATRGIDQRDRSRAVVHLLDWLGCVLAGAGTDVGVVLATYGRSAAQTGSAHAAVGGTWDAEGAAFLHGGVANTLELDDIHSGAILHPGPIVISAAMAVGEDRNVPIATLLDAIVLGYEACIRVGRSVGGHHARQFQNTTSCTPFGGAMAAAHLLSLDGTRTTHALGLAGTLASGLWQMQLELTSAKHYHSAHAARAGVTAARLAAAGMTGPSAILEGPGGFYAALCGDDVDAARIAAPVGSWQIHDTGFKLFPCCRHIHPAVGAARKLAAQVDVNTIASVQVDTYADALRFCNNPAPNTVREARFSLQHTVAWTLLHGNLWEDAFAPGAWNQTGVRQLARRIAVREASDLSRAYPEHFGTHVRIETAAGDVLEKRFADAPGDPALSATATELADKFIALCVLSGIAEKKAAQMHASLSEEKNWHQPIREIWRHLQR